MATAKFRHVLLILGCSLLFPLTSHADEQSTGFQISLFHPVQLFPDSYNVDGLRLDLIYGVNKDFQGVDIGFVNQINGYAQGVALGAVNIAKEDFKGVQVGIFYNDTEQEMQGLQLGIVNHAGSLEGIQIGIINFDDDNRYLGFMPFINASF